MRVERKLRGLLPPWLKGWLRHKRGHYRDFYPFGFAMNGQTARLEAVREIIHVCQIERIIETGTFRGTTTEWLAGFGIPVISIEAHASSYEFSKRRLASFRNVIVEESNSVDALGAILPELPKAVPIFFYLDAHWDNYLPLRDELHLICSFLEDFVIVVDDFEVTGDPGYTFDDYGFGKSLTEGYLRTTDAAHLNLFYPVVPSHEETGARRGWVVIAGSAKMSESLDQISLLKRRERLRRVER
jgi:hypothetical protein